jgi:sulfoxide reductase catalytic subunit YedY
MHVIRRRGWNPNASPRLSTRFDWRAFPAATGAAALSLSPSIARAQRVSDLPDPTKDLYPVKRNEAFTLDRPVTEEKINLNYNNFYEFGMSKNIAKAAQALKLRPWAVKIDGMVEKAQEIGLDDLIRKMPLEERLYRHRCVEAWSMAIPWSGFPFARLVELAKRLAKYVRMVPSSIPRSRRGSGLANIPGLVEGLTIAEATTSCSFWHWRLRRYVEAAGRAAAARGAVEIRFQVDCRSCASTSRISGRKAIGKRCRPPNTASNNVNPQVSHPRWSQATEELIGKASAGRRCCTTVMTTSQVSTKASRRNGSGVTRLRHGASKERTRVNSLNAPSGLRRRVTRRGGRGESAG